MIDDDRGVSQTLGYVLSIAIATLLVTGLLISGGNFIDAQQERVVRSELRVVGQRLAADIEHVDRLVVASDGDTTVRLTQTLPGSAVGDQYDLKLTAEQTPELVLTSRGGDVEVTIPISNQTSVAAAEVDSGTIVIKYDGTDITLTNADE